jgi:hypothetical protein
MKIQDWTGVQVHENLPWSLILTTFFPQVPRSTEKGMVCIQVSVGCSSKFTSVATLLASRW